MVIDELLFKESPFILGLLHEGYTEATLNNKMQKFTIPINRKLGEVSRKLNLSIELKLKTARDSYATTLKRAGRSKDEISEMLGHANSIVTEHYLATLDIEKTWEINESLY